MIIQNQSAYSISCNCYIQCVRKTIIKFTSTFIIIHMDFKSFMRVVGEFFLKEDAHFNEYIYLSTRRILFKING